MLSSLYHTPSNFLFKKGHTMHISGHPTIQFYETKTYTKGTHRKSPQKSFFSALNISQELLRILHNSYMSKTKVIKQQTK